MSGVTKDAGPASCAVVASQWAGGAVRENEVLFSVFFVDKVPALGRVRTPVLQKVLQHESGLLKFIAHSSECRSTPSKL